MSSLVAYADSESEEETLDQKEEGDPASVATGSSEQNQEVTVCNCSEVKLSHQSFTPELDSSMLEFHIVSEGTSSSRHLHSQSQNCFGWEREYCSDRSTQDEHCTDTTAPLNLGATPGKMLQLQTVPHMAQIFDDKVKPAKRFCIDSHSVRPYIPKRQRLTTLTETVDSKFTGSRLEDVQGNQTRERQILSEVSERIQPYIACKRDAAAIPRKLLMSLGGHQGPVNKLQWCPVPHLSHLLLSASMDKTFKV